MNIKKVLTAGLVVSLFSLGFVMINGDSQVLATQPGSADDPLISRSYLEERLANLNLGQAGQGISDELLSFLIEDITASVLRQVSGGSVASDFVYTPVNATNGQIIIGAEGTEIILRAGSAFAYSEVANGIVNATTGTELLGGEDIAINNLLIVPRSDGRGVLITSGDAWFIIRGEFTIR